MAKTLKSGAFQVQAFGNSYILSTNLGWVLCNIMYINMYTFLYIYAKRTRDRVDISLNMDEFLTFYWQKGLKFELFFQMI